MHHINLEFWFRVNQLTNHELDDALMRRSDTIEYIINYATAKQVSKIYEARQHNTAEWQHASHLHF